MSKKIELSEDTLKSIREALGATVEAEVTKVPSENSPFLGQLVLVRTYSAGVHVGELVAKTGTNVLLSDSVRLWRWEGAFTLSEAARVGVGANSRISAEVPLIELTQAIEILPVSAKAAETLKTRNNG